MKLSYLSWAWAWAQLKHNYESSTYEFTKFGKTSEWDEGSDVLVYSDGTCSVECTVEVEGQKHSMWLPVMDHRNNAISNPDARAINDTKMRALVKAIAMHGLGFSLFAGSDLEFLDEPPKPAPRKTAPKTAPKAAPKKKEEKPLTEEESAELQTATFNIFKVFAEGAKTTKELNAFWRKNASQLKIFSKEEPALYEEILKIFRDKKTELEGAKG